MGVTEAVQGVLALPDPQRSDAVYTLLRAIGPAEDSDDPQAIDAAWATEAERLLAEYRAGRLEVIDADQAMNEIREGRVP